MVENSVVILFQNCLKPVDDLTKLFSKLRKDKKVLSERDHHFKTYVGVPTPFIKLEV